MNRILFYPLFLLAGLLCSQAAEAPASSLMADVRAAVAAGDYAKANSLLEPLTGADAKDAEPFYLLSQLRLAQKNAAEAVKLAEKATTLDATKAKYFTQLGSALGSRIGEVNFVEKASMSGKMKKAFTKAVELDPNDVGGLIGLSRFYSNAPEIAGGSIEKAKEYALKIQKLDPYLGEVELAYVAERDENFAEAYTHLDAAAKLKPTNAWAQVNCGKMLVKLGRKDEARARFEAALKISPDNSGAKKGIADLDTPTK